MTTKGCSRRQMLGMTARIAAGTAFAENGLTSAAGFQLAHPEPLRDSSITLVSTSESEAWQEGVVFKPTFSFEMLNLNVDPSEASPAAPSMQGFGACFNELSWTSLQMLSEQDRESVLHELFDPTAGARFSYCRMLVGANDFSTGAYSYDETDGDFDLKHFSIEHDKQTLVPFIRAALRFQPQLKLT